MTSLRGRVSPAGARDSVPPAEAGCRSGAQEYLAGLKEVLDALPLDDVDELIRLLEDAHEQSEHVFIAGNGGSAATASHMACDLGKMVLGRPIRPDLKRFKVTALADNVPLMTAWGNDAGYESIFAEQLRNLAGSGDLLVVISGSGSSPNIVEAVRAARELGMRTAGLLGFDGGAVRQLLDHCVVVPSNDYGHIEDAHMAINHLITAYFKRALSNRRAPGT